MLNSDDEQWQRPKIVFVTAVPLTQWHFLEGQIPFLKASGFEVHSVAAGGPLLDKLAQRDSIPVHPVSISRRISPLRDLVALWQLFLLFRRIRPDILHVSTPKAALLGSLAGWICAVPVRIYLMRGLRSDSTAGLSGRALRLLESLAPRLCHRTWCVSPSVMESAVAAGMIKPGEGEVLVNGMSNGICPKRFAQKLHAPAPPLAERLDSLRSAGAQIIGFVGRLCADKGLCELVAVWELLRSRHPALHLLLVGPWDMAQPAPEGVRRALEQDERVFCTGYLDPPHPLYERMDLLLFPSHREGFPNVPMEAALAGLPVVATRAVGTVDAVLNGVTGTLIERGDVRGMADACTGYLQDAGLRRKHGEAGRNRALREFAPEPIWRASLHVYQTLLQERRGQAAHGRPADS